MYRTPLATLSNVELLRLLDGKRAFSFFIEELCQRVEVAEVPPTPVTDSSGQACPICEAMLTMSYDFATANFTLEVQKP